MKKNYITAEAKIEYLTLTDVITASFQLCTDNSAAEDEMSLAKFLEI